MKITTIKLSDLKFFKTFSADFFLLTSEESRQRVGTMNDEEIDTELYNLLIKQGLLKILKLSNSTYIKKLIERSIYGRNYKIFEKEGLTPELEFSEYKTPNMIDKKQILAILYNKNIMEDVGNKHLEKLIEREKKLKKTIFNFQNLLNSLKIN